LLTLALAGRVVRRYIDTKVELAETLCALDAATPKHLILLIAKRAMPESPRGEAPVLVHRGPQTLVIQPLTKERNAADTDQILPNPTLRLILKLKGSLFQAAT